jgi:serine/threonine protein kinase
VIVTEGGEAALVDYGISEISDELNVKHDEHPKLVLLAPEGIAAGKMVVSPAVDIWRFGLICHLLFLGVLPFLEKNSVAMMRRILAGDLQIAETCRKEIAELIERCLQTDPSKRPTADFLLGKFRALLSERIAVPHAQSFGPREWAAARKRTSTAEGDMSRIQTMVFSRPSNDRLLENPAVRMRVRTIGDMRDKRSMS